MSEMIERVAEAIYLAHIKNYAGLAKQPEGKWEQLADWQKDYGRAQARAAIEAMREPTDAMIEAGWQDGMAGFGEGEECEPVWHAMIDEALK